MFGISSITFAQVKEHEIIAKDNLGNVTFFKLKESKVTSDIRSIQGFLQEQYDLDINSTFKQSQSSITNNIETKKYQQFYNDIRVEYGEIVISSTNNKVKTINGKIYSIKNFTTIPTLTSDNALHNALTSLKSSKLAWEDELFEKGLKFETKDNNSTYRPKGELVIIDKDLFDDKFEPVLCYKFNIYSLIPLFRDYIFVDANTGEIVFRDPIIKHIEGTASTRYSGTRTIETQQNGNNFRLRDYSRGNGIETYNLNKGTNYGSAVDFIDNNNNWSNAEYNNSNKDNAALDAHWGAEKTYDYFLQKHGRNSYDNNGAVIRNYVHYGNNYDNAFWDGQRMTYGDGGFTFDALTSIDVVAHEIGHGICNYTANLVYKNEPGAINEGLSDIWGAMVEFYAAPEKQTYLIGEEIILGGGSLRSMSNPNSRNHPSTYQGTYWYSGSGDNGGVHTNSSVLNYWFYLLAEGGNGTNDIGNSFDINGIGKEKASQIVYHAESVYFGSTTNYSQARYLTIQAAEDLFGENSVESATVCQSWFAVGLGNNNCTIDIKLNGNENICETTTANYILSYTPTDTTVIWSLSSNLIKLSSNNSSITVKPSSSNVNGVGTISANINGNIIQKVIWIGKPKFDLQLETLGTNYVNAFMIGDGFDINQQGITTTSWQKVSSSGCPSSFGGAGYSAHGNGNCNNWSVYAKITATNSCGTTTLFTTITPRASNPCYNITLDDNNTVIIEDPCFNGITDNNQNSIKEIFVYDLSGILLQHSKSNQLNFNFQSSKVYILRIKLINGEIITEKIIK